MYPALFLGDFFMLWKEGEKKEGIRVLERNFTGSICEHTVLARMWSQNISILFSSVETKMANPRQVQPARSDTPLRGYSAPSGPTALSASP